MRSVLPRYTEDIRFSYTCTAPASGSRPERVSVGPEGMHVACFLYNGFRGLP